MNLLIAPLTQKRARRIERVFWPFTQNVLLFAVLSGCGGGGGNSSSRPLSVDAQRTVVFQSNRDGDFEILRMKGDGRDVERITNNAAIDSEPSISPEGNSIVFASARTGNKELYVIDSTGTKQITRNLFNDDIPSFRSDGEKVIFNSSREGKSNIFTVDLLTGQENQLTFSDSFKNKSVFSSQGKILFSSNVNSDIFQIYEISNDGKELKQITNDSFNHAFFGVSPDGKTIVYSAEDTGSADIYLLDRVTGAVKALTGQSKNNVEPTFSRDGQRIFFASDRTGNYDIYSMNLDGSDVQNLTNNPASDRAPSAQ